MRAVGLLALLLFLPVAAAAPEQVHLGARDASLIDGYAVSWVERDPQGPAAVVFHGPSGETRIDARVVPGPTPGIVNEARLPRLTPGTNASYSIGDREFPLRVPSATHLNVVALGDMGVTREAGNAVERILGESPDLVLHLGDISYAGGDPTVWTRWFELVEPVASSIPWLPALGNHEGDVLGLETDEASVIDPAEQAVFRQRFPLPRETFWYSFDLAGVHFVALDTFSEVTMPAAERAWLEADLNAAGGADWIIVYLHEAIHSSNLAHGSSPRATNEFMSILDAHNVDLVLAGHDHDYERSWPIRGGEVIARVDQTPKGNGTVYIVTGGAGAQLYEEFADPQPTWSAVRQAVHHVLALNITRDRIEGRTIATGSTEFEDRFAIVRTRDEVPHDAATSALGLVPLAIAIAILAFGSRRAR